MTLAQLMAEAQHCPPPRGLSSWPCSRAPGVAVIAEVKRRSPSKGPLAPDLVPGVLAKAYAGAGAACLSVLTDQEFFGGSADDLAEARAAVDLPVLRKDFTVCAADVCDARLMGADAVLLIVGALSPAELAELLGLAGVSGSTPSSKCTTKPKRSAALAAGADMVGVNQRDLVTFPGRHRPGGAGGASLPDRRGARGRVGHPYTDDVRRLADAGFDAVLVGEALVTSADPGAALAALRGAEGP